jgi:hypothetical protein
VIPSARRSGRVYPQPPLPGPVCHEPRPPRSRGRGGVPPALPYRGCRGLWGTCPRDPLSAVQRAACTPVPPPPSAPPARQPAPRGAGLRGGFGLDGDFGGLQAPKVSAQPKVSKIFSDHRFRRGRVRSLRLSGLPAPPAGPWPPGPRVPLATGAARRLATGAARAHGPASVCAARTMGDHRSIVASMVRLRAQLARPPLLGSGCRRVVCAAAAAILARAVVPQAPLVRQRPITVEDPASALISSTSNMVVNRGTGVVLVSEGAARAGQRA